jgi:hypothetical protein
MKLALAAWLSLPPIMAGPVLAADAGQPAAARIAATPPGGVPVPTAMNMGVSVQRAMVLSSAGSDSK